MRSCIPQKQPPARMARSVMAGMVTPFEMADRGRTLNFNRVR
jgi:hypothetical protein